MRGLPAYVNNILDEYLTLFHVRLPNTLEGFYLQGSIALDAYVEDSSDIDFIAIINRRLSEGECEILAEIHRAIESTYSKPEMDGVYLMWADIGKLAPDDTDYPFYNGGQLSYGAHFNAITWWILKKHGISIIGPQPTALNVEIDPQHLVEYVVGNMNRYWAGRIEKIEHAMKNMLQFTTEEIDVEIEWSILGLLRQYYTLKEHGIISKLGAGEYAFLHMPEEWHPIIQEAIDIRKGAVRNRFSSDRERMDKALKFSKYMIDYCNRHLSFNKIGHPNSQ
ncbi:aminoglycoside adenylyltransferase domain-containing protein [Sporosarcina sp. YIM B06819]|uniref:aminoglycoside adenylyltransferase domain-containing protein n=1 Tax=Sporosarcina sp. YIM B06819 TaxID=3081769 RepID=UPI00298BCBC6|nr:aminoglycoside adenylyltransferase domain-containing protein [Sporosarcina sp. YIM B06819]